MIALYWFIAYFFIACFVVYILIGVCVEAWELKHPLTAEQQAQLNRDNEYFDNLGPDMMP